MDDQNSSYIPDQQPDQIPDDIEGYLPGRRPSRKPKDPNRKPDPGSRKAGWIALCFLIPVLAFVVYTQQSSVMKATADAEAKAQEIVPSGRADTFGLISRFTVKFHHLLVSIDENEGANALDQAGYLDTVDDMAFSPHEMLRAAIVAAEVVGEDEALERISGVNFYLTEVRDELDPTYYEAVYEDANLVADIYVGIALTDDQKQQLITRHGWHGKLALSYGKDNDDPERAELIGGGGRLMVFLVLFGLVIVVALLGGFGLLITGIILLATEKMKMRFRPPAVGGSVYLETFAVFVGMFMVLQLATDALVGKLPVSVLYGSQWLVALSIFWPMVRGVSIKRWREDMGLVAPEGVFKEIWYGLLTYLACVPLYFAAAMVSLLLIALRTLLSTPSNGNSEAAVEAPMTNPIIELLESADIVTIAVLGSLMIVWAPLVEECIMRGALFRHFRSRFVFVISGLFSAVLFGFLHQYDVLMLVPIITLGAAFAFMREWRGTLVGCFTAHALHNGTIFLLIVWLVSLV
jgi:membrane protease YdiL (CAAX protease family)